MTLPIVLGGIAGYLLVVALLCVFFRGVKRFQED